jgi:hypothetical protein
MNLNLQVVVSYSDIWDDNPPEFDELLQDIPSKISIQCITHFLAQLHAVNQTRETQFEILNTWLKRQETSLKRRFNTFLQSNLAKNSYFNFINIYSCLHLTQQIILNYNKTEADTLTSEDELKLLKAYLLSSKKWIKKTEHITNKARKYETEEELLELILPTQLSLFDIIKFENFSIQTYKSIYFFEFAESENPYNKCLELFLDSRNVDTWQIYLKEILSIYISSVNKEPKKSVIKITDPDVKQLMDTLCLDPSIYKPVEDFIKIREKPVVKLEENEYLFLNWNFFVDKIFNGILFDISNAVKGIEIEKDIVFETLGDIKSTLSNDFSEKVLFNQVMGLCFEKFPSVQIKESEIPKEVTSKPDYYIRRKSKIFLFEFKDALFSSEAKNSQDYNKIKEEIYKKLVWDDNKDPKGISQLVDNIVRIRNNDFTKIDDTNFSNAKYYPIIVLTDYTFDIYGVNSIIRREFNNQIEELELDDKHLLKNPVVIGLDDLIKYQELFNKGNFRLNSILDEYNNFVSSDDILKSISSFSEFLEGKINKGELKPPEEIMKQISRVLDLPNA